MSGEEQNKDPSIPTLFGAVILILVGLMLINGIPGVTQRPEELPQNPKEPTYDLQSKKLEIFCIEKAERKYDDMGLLEAELDISKSDIRDLFYRLEDQGYIRTGGLFEKAGGTRKWYESLDQVNATYCNKVLEFSKVVPE